MLPAPAWVSRSDGRDPPDISTPDALKKAFRQRHPAYVGQAQRHRSSRRFMLLASRRDAGEDSFGAGAAAPWPRARPRWPDADQRNFPGWRDARDAAGVAQVFTLSSRGVRMHRRLRLRAGRLRCCVSCVAATIKEKACGPQPRPIDLPADSGRADVRRNERRRRVWRSVTALTYGSVSCCSPELISGRARWAILPLPSTLPPRLASSDPAHRARVTQQHEWNAHYG
jgi:hypothetical protein